MKITTYPNDSAWIFHDFNYRNSNLWSNINLFLRKDKRWSVEAVVSVEGWNYFEECIHLPNVLPQPTDDIWDRNDA